MSYVFGSKWIPKIDEIGCFAGLVFLPVLGLVD